MQDNMNPPLAQNEEQAKISTPNNDDRLPSNVAHEIFNENQLLKQLLQDDIAEGM